MMQDGKALQAGTSHFLGQNFAKSSEIKFQDKDGKEEYAWTTSWGVSTRLIGALIMAHSDDDGLVLPPRLAPRHVVILPIYRNDEEREAVLAYCKQLRADLRAQTYADGRLEVELDDRDLRGGEKTWYHIKRGVPVRLEVGPRDVAAGAVFMGRRDKGPKEKQSMPREEFVAKAVEILEDIQTSLLERARAFQAANTRTITDRKEFEAYFTPANENKPEIHGGFVLAPFVDDPAVEEALSALKVTVRCVPIDQEPKPATCMFTGKPTDRWAIYAKAY
jgi:prolyl-tRNA synthetase